VVVKLGVNEPVEGVLIEIVEIVRDEVGQGAVFELTPKLLNRIEVGSIRRQVFDGETWIVGEELTDGCGFVHRTVVPNDDDGSPQVSEQITDEVGHIGGAKVAVGSSLEVETGPAGDGRN
jgi:hypothetical protein